MNLRFKSFAVLLLALSTVLMASRNARALVGQQKTCGNAPQSRAITLTVVEKIIDLGEGLKTQAWTFNGTVPGPLIEVCEGDTVKVTMKNEGTSAHGIDSHAFRLSHEKFGPVETGKELSFQKKIDTPGVFMYHCAAGPVTDQHIKMGMYGVMIVYPRNVVYGVQTYSVPAGSGDIFEFTASEPGNFLLVDHNFLSQLPNGLAIPFSAQ